MKNTLKVPKEFTKIDIPKSIPNQDKKRIRKPKEKNISKTAIIKFHPAGVAILLILCFCYPAAWAMIPKGLQIIFWLLAGLDFFDVRTEIKED